MIPTKCICIVYFAKVSLHAVAVCVFQITLQCLSVLCVVRCNILHILDFIYNNVYQQFVYFRLNVQCIYSNFVLLHPVTICVLQTTRTVYVVTVCRFML